MFTILTPENTARITLTDSRPNNSDTQIWDIYASHKGVDLAVQMYARQRGISPDRVGYSLTLPEGMVKMPVE